MAKLIYIANIRLPTEKAHGIQIMKTCEAFTATGSVVELVIPWRFNSIKGDPFEYYSIKTKFKITRIFSLDLVRYGKWGFIIQLATFGLSAFFYTMFSKKDFIYGRDEFPLILSSLHSRIIWETHTGSYSRTVRALLNRNIRMVAISNGLKDLYVRNGVNPNHIFVAPDSVDTELFDIRISKEEARRKLNLPLDKKIVLYTGHLYDWKGAHVLGEAARLLPTDISIVFVGGTESDVRSFKERFGSIQNVFILGKKPYNEIPVFLKAADILTLPNSPVNDNSSFYTSPMKLFEYMASGRPIIASDLLSIREILDENNSVLVSPNNPKLLAEGIIKILSDDNLREKIQSQSYRDSKLYTWQNRVKEIIDFIK